MARMRLKLKLVSCERARKITFRKRKQGLVKKMEEITTLCGIDGCIVIYNNPEENEPYVWPSRERAMEMIAKYESMPQCNQDTRKVDHEKFMQDRVDKLREEVKKWKTKNMETHASLILNQLINQGKSMEDLDIMEIKLLRWFSDLKMNEIYKQITLLPPIGLPPQIFSKFLSPIQVPQEQPIDPYPPPSMENDPPTYQIQNDPFYKNMFGYGYGDGIGISGVESSNGNQQHDFDYEGTRSGRA